MIKMIEVQGWSKAYSHHRKSSGWVYYRVLKLKNEEELWVKIDINRDTNKDTTDGLKMNKMIEVQGWSKVYSYCRRCSKWCRWLWKRVLKLKSEDELGMKIDTNRDTDKDATDGLKMVKMIEVQGWSKVYSYCRRCSKWCGWLWKRVLK